MKPVADHMSSEKWLANIFASAEAWRGGVVKRQISDVERLVGREPFAREVARRGYPAVENHRHLVIFCKTAPSRKVGREGPFHI